jgi:hypothetical protein
MTDKPKITDFTAEVKLTPEQVKEACRRYVYNELGFEATNVRFSVSDTSDDRFGHSPSYDLTGITVTVKANRG